MTRKRKDDRGATPNAGKSPRKTEASKSVRAADEKRRGSDAMGGARRGSGLPDREPRSGAPDAEKGPDGAATSNRRRLWTALGAVGALALAAMLTVFRPWGSPGGGGSSGPRLPFPPPTIMADSSRIASNDFAGSEACASCHRTEYESWTRSTHAAAGGTPGRVTVIAHFNGQPIRFRDAVVIPAARGSEYSFTVRQEGRAERVFRVDGVVGGGHMQGGGTQGFVSKFPDGTYRFLPFDFARNEGTWFCNTASRANKGWIPITAAVALADCGDWPPARVLGDELRFPNCQSCHGSQIDVVLDTAAHQYRSRFTSLAVNCESCHGPARTHIESVRGRQRSGGDVGMRPLITLTKDASLGVCWQCHALKDRLRNGYLSGKRLDVYYALLLPQLGNAAHFPDGRVRTFAYQQGHLWSDCYVSGGMTCTSCHDPHSQDYRDVSGTPLVGRFDDRQCTGCHQSKATDVVRHTKHAAGSAGSRCVSCHMPYLQEPEIGTAVRYARSDHSIPVPRPAGDSALGVRSACKSCHADRSELALDAQVRHWYGELKPQPRAVAAALQLSAIDDRVRAAALVLDSAETRAAALFAGMSKFAEQFLSPDMNDLEPDVVRRLEGLGAHPDLDVRALAMASLHLAAGERADIRRHLAARIGALGRDELPVRARWALALGFFADRQRERGDATGAVTVYRKALEVEPTNPRILLNLGVAYAQAGLMAEAVESYRASLALNPTQPLALINLGIALSATKDKGGAVDAYRRAIAMNAREALAWFNLGNIYFERGDHASAIGAYQKAVESDPSLPLAHFYLARSLAKRGDIARAMQEVEAGLEFDPGNQEALAARETLRRISRGAP